MTEDFSKTQNARHSEQSKTSVNECDQNTVGVLRQVVVEQRRNTQHPQSRTTVGESGRTILSVQNLTVSFRTDKGIVHAVRNISFDVKRGETLAIVGESGSGKSVTSKAILGIEAANSIIESGKIFFEEKDLLKFTEKDFNKIRGNKITMVFQDPMSSLDPIVKIGTQLTEASILNGKTNQKLAAKKIKLYLKNISNKSERKNLTKLIKQNEKIYQKYFKENQNAQTDFFNAEELFQDKKNQLSDELKLLIKQKSFRVTKKIAYLKALKIMEEVGIKESEKRFNQYPFEFSGGMRQRIVIAIAIAANPELLICDEPTTALDVTIQAQILELINKLKKERNMTVIFITHDLGVVANVADRIAVMYAGKIVEIGTSKDIFYNPKHPYTWALLSSIPDLNTKDKLEAIPGTPPNMLFVPQGDAFAPRNKYAMQIDFEKEPPLFKVSDTHFAATWLLHPNAPKVEMPKILKDRIANKHENRHCEE